MVHGLATVAEFNEKVIGADASKLVVVDFWATWCGPCINIAPTYEKMAGEMTDVDFYKVDVDAAEEITAEQGIECMPTFKLFKGGKCVDTLQGASEAKLRSLIAQHK